MGKWTVLITVRLHAVSEPFFQQVTKRKTTSDPLPPGGSSKDKILHTEALGLVMIDYGDAVVGGFGMSLLFTVHSHQPDLSLVGWWAELTCVRGQFGKVWAGTM